MSTAVSTANQLSERVHQVAAAASVPNIRVSARLTTDGTKLYASITCQRSADAEQLITAIRREATAEFGEQGSKLTARRDFLHVHVFLPVEKADGSRRAAFLSASFSTPKGF